MKRRQQIQRQRTQRHRQSTVDDGGLITTVTAVADGDGDDIIAAAPQDDHAAENGTTSTDDVDRIKPDISEGDKLFEAAGGNATQSAPTSLDNYDFEKAKFRYDYDIDDGGGGDGNNNNAAAEMQALRRGSIIMPSAHPNGSNDNTFNKRCLPEDTFSFVIYSPVTSRPFFLASMVFSLQIAIFVILAVDIIDISNVQNPFMWPANVETPVRIIEALAIVIAIITQDDVRKAVNLLREGFDKDLPKAFPGACMWKWALSILLRGSEGLLGLFVTFLLVMQSNNVLDLLLNFSAMEFVTLLDDVIFALTSEGFLGRVLKKEATRLSGTYYNISRPSVDSRSASFVTLAYFLVLFAVMFAGYGVIFANQAAGKYLCDQVFVQFGDELLPMLGTISGVLYRHKQTFGGRLSYRDDRVGGPLLAYCDADNRWTLSLSTDNVPDPCDWLAASAETIEFDVLTTAESPWIVKTGNKRRVVPLLIHYLACYDCMYNNDDFCGEFGTCVETKNNGKCECDDDHFGLRCEYDVPCERLEIDPAGGEFLKVVNRNFSSKFYRLKGATTYNHPVYTELGENGTLNRGTDIMLFTGVRWILSYKNLFPGLNDVNDVEGLVRYFSQFHGFFTEYGAAFMSEPVYIDTQADDKSSPAGLRWLPAPSTKGLQPFKSKAVNMQQDFVDSSFICVVCDNVTNPCSFGAICSNGACGVCPNESTGSMCQIPPVGNGQCNSYFNNINFGFDGGDCCESECLSTPEHICGKTDNGYIDTGYPFCVSASDDWKLSGDQIFGVSSASRSGLAIALSGNGNILAVSDPRISVVRLFDKEGSEWIQRGQNVEGPRNQQGDSFGVSISLSDESVNITRNSLTSPTVTLAIGAHTLGLVRVYLCTTVGCIQRGGDITGNKGFGYSLSMAKDGKSIAIGGADTDTISPTGKNRDGSVKVFTWTNGNWEQRGNVTIERPSSRKLLIDRYSLQGYYVSLSGDYLAVGTLEGEVTPGPRFESAELITQVYKWDESGLSWAQLGGEIVKPFYNEGMFRVAWSLKPIVIKGNTTLAIGSKSSAAVYSWNETSSEWLARKVELDTTAETDGLGWSIDLSNDGNILAIGRNVEDEKIDDAIRMYKWDGKRYKQLSNGLPGGLVPSISLSGEGNAIAVGLPFDAWKGGKTGVYKYQTSASVCASPSEVPLRISLTTDARPEETSWELRVDSEVKRSSGSLARNMYTTFVEEMCIPANSCVKFIVYDSRGNGLNTPGVYSIMMNGTEVARGGGAFGYSDEKSVGNCD